jgi:FtsP/CotA-like multicopper oxidase with cupredoxin domain
MPKIKIGISSAAALAVLALGLGSALLAQDVLDPTIIPKYEAALVIPPAMPAALKTFFLDYYEIAMRQFPQQILPSGFGPTTVWSYGPAGESGADNEGLHATAGGHYFYPAFTIEARNRKPVRVKWVNELKTGSGAYRPHLLPVDQTLHWANPPGGEMERDMRPTFTETPGPYTGPVPMITHLHGAVGVGDESDGYAEAWFLPAANNIPAGYATVGTWHAFFKAKAERRFGRPWGDGFTIFQYPNSQRAATLWYHDHTVGMTRANVYAGPAGFYLIRGGGEDRDLGFNPPSETLGVGVDPAQIITEVPVAIQDRSFKTDGSLFYPDSRAFFDGITGPYIPGSDLSPIWNPEFFGNTMVVNGQTWPYMNVEQRRYRFRLLNGCNSRVLILKFDHPDVRIWQIGTEGGFLPAPLDVAGFSVAGIDGAILLGLAERADLIVDFSGVPAGTSFELINLGPDEPFGGGIAGVDFPSADPNTTGQVLQFRVTAASGPDDSTPPQSMALPVIGRMNGGTVRPLALLEEMSMYPGFDGPREAVLGTMSGGVPTPKLWQDPITENPKVAETQVWEIYNFTADAHPIHVHEVHFQVVNRQALATDEAGETEVPATLVGSPQAPEPWEDGSFKDTVLAYPGQVTRIRARFALPGLFVWHCHIVEHEDNEMMRPFFIGGPIAKLFYELYIRRQGRTLFGGPGMGDARPELERSRPGVISRSLILR